MIVSHNVEKTRLIGRLKGSKRNKRVLEGQFQTEERQKRRNTRKKHVFIIEVEQ